jgi:exopolysaccharide biosynthesis protein
VVNGPYFQTFSDASYAPAGLLVRDGKSLGRIDAADPNLSIIFRISSGSVASISPIVNASAQDLADAKIAFQAGPLLVQSGVIAVTDASSWHAAGAYPRTALGIDADGKIRLFASAKPCSLREFTARILQSAPAIREAVNLDGGPSTSYA